MRLDSKSATRRLGSKCRSQAAAARPVKPPPTMAKSTASGTVSSSEWNSIVQGGRPHRGIRAVLAGSVALIAIGGIRLDTAADGRLRTVERVAK